MFPTSKWFSSVGHGTLGRVNSSLVHFHWGPNHALVGTAHVSRVTSQKHDTVYPEGQTVTTTKEIMENIKHFILLPLWHIVYRTKQTVSI